MVNDCDNLTVDPSTLDLIQSRRCQSAKQLPPTRSINCIRSARRKCSRPGNDHNDILALMEKAFHAIASGIPGEWSKFNSYSHSPQADETFIHNVSCLERGTGGYC
jgi:hypothetical protein